MRGVLGGKNTSDIGKRKKYIIPFPVGKTRWRRASPYDGWLRIPRRRNQTKISILEIDAVELFRKAPIVLQPVDRQWALLSAPTAEISPQHGFQPRVEKKGSLLNPPSRPRIIPQEYSVADIPKAPPLSVSSPHLVAPPVLCLVWRRIGMWVDGLTGPKIRDIEMKYNQQNIRYY